MGAKRPGRHIRPRLAAAGSVCRRSLFLRVVFHRRCRMRALSAGGANPAVTVDMRVRPWCPTSGVVKSSIPPGCESRLSRGTHAARPRPAPKRSRGRSTGDPDPGALCSLAGLFLSSFNLFLSSLDSRFTEVRSHPKSAKIHYDRGLTER